MRKLSFGTNWTTLRIGFRYYIAWANGGGITQPRWCCGVSNGTTAGPGSPNTTDFLGVVFSGWTVGFTGSSTFYTGNGRVSDGIRKVGADATIVVGTNSNGNYWNQNSNIAVPVAMEVTKLSSTSYSVRSTYMENSSLCVNMTRSNFLLQMEAATPFTTNWCISKTLTGGTNYDSVCVSWGKSMPTLTISELTVMRFN